MTSRAKVSRLLRLAALAIAASAAVAAAVLASPNPQSADAADPGETIFQSKCASCHTIGGGPLVGPDLKGVTSQRDHAWLVDMITTPDQLIAKGDPNVKELMTKYPIPMPNLGISKADAESILTYIDARSSGAAPAAAPQPAAQPGDPAKGYALFAGQHPLTNGGPACATCHSVGGPNPVEGGSLGPNLTQEYTKLGDQGLAAALAGLPFPTMMPIYGTRQLTPQEQADLKAFFQASAEAQASGADTLQYAVYAVVGAVVLFALAHLLWRQRLGGVHRSFIKRAFR